MPGKHTVHRLQRGAFVVVVKVPLGHAAHTRSVFAVGAEDSYVPGTHVARAPTAGAGPTAAFASGP